MKQLCATFAILMLVTTLTATSCSEINISPSSEGTYSTTPSGTTTQTLHETTAELPTTASPQPTTSTFSQLSIKAIADTLSGNAVLPVHFTASVSGGTPPYQYSWDFNASDGIKVDKYHRDASIVYSIPGTYQVTLTVTDCAGNQAVDALEIEVLPQKVVSSASITLINQHGTPDNPIIIEDLDITTTDGNAISLIYCSYVLIRNNYIHNVSDSSGLGIKGNAIYVQDSSHIYITGNYLTDNMRGMYIAATPESEFQEDIRVGENVVFNCSRDSAINLRRSNNLEVYNNYLRDNGDVAFFENGRISGIMVNDAHGVSVHDNLVIHSSSDGICIAFSRETYEKDPRFRTTDIEVFNNTSRENGEQGIWMQGINNGEVYCNYLENNYNESPALGSSGIMMEAAVSGLKIYQNVFENNEVAGISINMSSDNEIYENIFHEPSSGHGSIWINAIIPADWFKENLSSVNNIIRDNIIHESRLGVKMEKANSTQIMHNKIYNNGPFNDGPYKNIGGILICPGSTNTIVSNNILENNHGIAIFDEGRYTVITGNKVIGKTE